MGVLPAATVARILIVILVLPLMCGSFFAARLRCYEGRGFLLNAYVFGWIIVFCMFEVVCTPYVVILGKFSSFYRVFNIVILIASAVSVIAAVIVLCRRRKPAKERGMEVSGEDADEEECAERISIAGTDKEERVEGTSGAGADKEECAERISIAGTDKEERVEGTSGAGADKEERAEGISIAGADKEERAIGTRGCEADGKTAPDKTAWWAWVLWAIVIASVLLQMVFFYFYNHMNGDDSYYIAQSVITDLIDTMYQRDAYTGTPMGLDVRHALAVLPVFVTWLGRVCGLHAATAAHAILGPVLLAMCYASYALVGKALFAKKRSMVPLFVLLVQMWYLSGNVSIFTPETFLYTRTWQGKAVFANIILPLAFYLLYRLLTEWRSIYMILLLLLSVAGIFATTASVYLLSALYGITALYCLITQKKWKKFLSIAVCVAPAFLYGLVYLWLLRKW